MDTAQPPEAAETEVVSTADALANAADAFKVSLGQIAPEPDKPRDERGRFAAANSDEGEANEIDAEDEPQGEADATSDDVTDEADEAADEAQPDAVPMPSSWAKEDAETWAELSPAAQAKIAEREGQRDAAVNQKFQEAANLRRMNEAVIQEAANNRDRFAEMAEWAMSLIQPQEPSLSMLDVNSDDYDPDGYHLRRAQYQQTVAQLQQLNAQQQYAAQARAQQAEAEQMAFYQQINSATRDALVRDVPDLADQAKAPARLQELIEYATQNGAPAEMFQTPTTALEWHMLWKAREFDKLQSAKKRVSSTPAPEPRKAQPAVRPGVATTRSAAKHAQRQNDLGRLAKSGSVEDGAAMWKHFLKG